MSFAARQMQEVGVGLWRAAARLSRERPLRVLTFTSLFPNAEQPAHGLFVLRRLQQLCATGEVEATVVAPVPWFPSASPRFGRYAEFARVPDHEVMDGLEVHHPRYLVLPRIGMSAAPALMAFATRDCVKRLHRERGFDLIDAHYFYPDGVAACWLARSLDLPVAITARGTDLNLISQYALPRAMIRRAALASSLNVAVSDALAQRLREIGADPAAIRVIPNGVDLQEFRPGDRGDARRSLGLDDRRWLLTAGQLVTNKGHDAVIRALALLPGSGLLIAGEGRRRRVAPARGGFRRGGPRATAGARLARTNAPRLQRRGVPGACLVARGHAERAPREPRMRYARGRDPGGRLPGHRSRARSRPPDRRAGPGSNCRGGQRSSALAVACGRGGGVRAPLCVGSLDRAAARRVQAHREDVDRMRICTTIASARRTGSSCISRR
jgi:hypothetical protein